jgi:3-deoxy-manno-octulosonate cytidylyltransferase (CMP-KDO synthetase)
MKITGIIPSRYASTRLPGKPLKDIAGKPMIQRVYDAAKRVKILDRVIIATDDARIFEAAGKFTRDVVMTPECNTGTDRLAFVARGIDCDIVVNIQGDEPLLEPEMVVTAVKPMIENAGIQAATLATDFTGESEKAEPGNVKVITDLKGFAIYFSRLPLPNSMKHIGLYVFRKEFLLEFAAMKQTPLEIAEKLEQLRIIENGHRIYVSKTPFRTIGVDTEEDLARVRKMFTA